MSGSRLALVRDRQSPRIITKVRWIRQVERQKMLNRLSGIMIRVKSEIERLTRETEREQAELLADLAAGAEIEDGGRIT